MVRFLCAKQIIIGLTLICFLGVQIRPAHADEPTQPTATVPDPLVDNFLMKRVKAVSDSKNAPENLAYLFLTALTFYYGLGFVRSLTPEQITEAIMTRQVMKADLQDKRQALREWGVRKHNLWPELEKVEARLKLRQDHLAQVKARIAGGNRDAFQQTEDSLVESMIQAEIRQLETDRASLRGRIDATPTGTSKMAEALFQLDRLDTEFETNLQRLLKNAKDSNHKNAASLEQAVKEWQAGMGLYSLEKWLAVPDNKQFASKNKFIGVHTMLMENMGKHVKAAVAIENESRTQANKKLPPAKQRPLIDYRRTETGYDTRNFDLRREGPNHEPQRGQPITRGELRASTQMECDAGYEAAASEVRWAETRTSWGYTFRTPLTAAAGTSLGVLGFWGLNRYSTNKHNKTIGEVRAEGIALGQTIEQTEGDIGGQMKNEENGKNRFAPFLDFASEVLKKKSPQISARIARTYEGEPDEAQRLARLTKQESNLSNASTVRKNLKNGLFNIMTSYNFKTIERMVSLLYTEDDGERDTLTRRYVTEVVTEALNNLYAGTSENHAVNRMANDVVTEVVDEILEALKKQRNPVTAPVVPLPGNQTTPMPGSPGVAPAHPAPGKGAVSSTMGGAISTSAMRGASENVNASPLSPMDPQNQVVTNNPVPPVFLLPTRASVP